MVSDLGHIVHNDAELNVLILVLMEYGLWRVWTIGWGHTRGLNPCSNGIWSLTWHMLFQVHLLRLRLNPCSNGIWSLTVVKEVERQNRICLNPCSNGIWSLTWRDDARNRSRYVLILVLMEYGLWLRSVRSAVHWLLRLNPCSNGIWSLTVVYSTK